MSELYMPIDSVYNEMIVQYALRNRKICLNEDFNEVSMFKMRYYIEKIKNIDDQKNIPYGDREPIEIVINSYGGQIYEMLGTLSLIEHYKKEYKYTFITTLTGKAMSCGAVLFLFGDIRRMYSYGTLLFHQLSTTNWGNYEQLKVSFEENTRLQNLLDKIIVEKTNIPSGMLKEKTKGLDWYISPEECIKLGIATEII